MSDITTRRATSADKPEWLRMRLLLWPDGTVESFFREMDDLLADPLAPVFVAVRSNGLAGGFLEAGTRKYAEGCGTSPVAYIEGWYVDGDLHGRGIGKALVRAAEDWARSQGLTEIASDTWLDNEVSIQAHLKLGYEEIERLVHFAKKLH
ncbi:MAG: GNAT family N-acetyltransferase [Anaerolineales bacterium]|jgi:aminoglycoside 6'-N-acetyltransferase I